MFKLIVFLSLLCVYVQPLRLENVETYGEIDNFELLGIEFAVADAYENAEAIEFVTFPNVSLFKHDEFHTLIKEIIFLHFVFLFLLGFEREKMHNPWSEAL